MEKIKSLLHAGHKHETTSTGEVIDPDIKKLHGTYHNTSLDEHGRGVIPGKHYDEEASSSTSNTAATSGLETTDRGRQLDTPATTGAGITDGGAITGEEYGTTIGSSGLGSSTTDSGLATSASTIPSDDLTATRGADFGDSTATTTKTTSGFSGIQGEILPGPAHIPGAVVSEGQREYTPALAHLREHGLGSSDAGTYDSHLSGYKEVSSHTSGKDVLGDDDLVAQAATQGGAFAGSSADF